MSPAPPVSIDWNHFSASRAAREAFDAYAKHVRLGSAFAFLRKEALASPAFDGARAIMGAGAGARDRVVSLLGAPLALPGVTIGPARLQRMTLASLTSDKSVYREGRDVVRLLLVDALAAKRGARTASLACAGAAFRFLEVPIDGRGVGTAELRDLPAGDYRASCDGEQCEFTVAAYRLAKLDARLVSRSFTEGKLHVSLSIMRFGVPFDRDVSLQLASSHMPWTRIEVPCRHGICNASFELSGEGPYRINLQLASDPSSTATIPILGSRASERDETLFSTFGTRVHASLLPSPDARAVRGLFLRPSGSPEGPLHLERVDARRIVLTASVPVSAARFVVVDPRGSEPRVMTELEHGDLAAGTTIELDVPDPAALVVAGAFAWGEPWESWALAVPPEPPPPRIVVPERVLPGETIRIAIETGRPDEDVAVYTLVKDARLPSAETPMTRLAAGLKRFASSIGDALSGGVPRTDLRDIVEEQRSRPHRARALAGFGDEMFELSEPMLDVTYGISNESALSSPALEGMAEEWEEEAEEEESGPDEPQRGARPKDDDTSRDVLFAGLVPASGGVASLDVALFPDAADIVVEAFVVGNANWSSAEARFRAEAGRVLSFDMPLFVSPDEFAPARLFVRDEGARVRLTRDGAPVALRLSGRPFGEAEPLPAGLVELSFSADPGHYEATLEGGTGEPLTTARVVSDPKNLRRHLRGVRLLESGQKIGVADDPSIRSLRVLPGLDKPFRALVDATMRYEHSCAEQTAAKVLAACAAYTLAGGDAERRAGAEASIDAGLRRLERMWRRGEGFQPYPDIPSIDGYSGPLASRYLFHLELLRDLRGAAAPSAVLRSMIDQGLEMARDTARAYGIEWPPRAIRSGHEAYAALRFGGDRNAALAFAREHTAMLLDEMPEGWSLTHFRLERALVAACLLHAKIDLGHAIDLANHVVRDLGEQGRLYSTIDSVAAIALFVELEAVGMGAGAGVALVDGARLSTKEAMALSPASVEAVEGIVSVEVLREVEDDWSSVGDGVKLDVWLEKQGDRVVRARELDALDLCIWLVDGYVSGDLAWVSLPHAFSRVEGGAQIKRFSMDFAGGRVLRIPLATMARTVGPDGSPSPTRILVCVRNMFVEERGGYAEVCPTVV